MTFSSWWTAMPLPLLAIWSGSVGAGRQASGCALLPDDHYLGGRNLEANQMEFRVEVELNFKIG